MKTNPVTPRRFRVLYERLSEEYTTHQVWITVLIRAVEITKDQHTRFILLISIWRCIMRLGQLQRGKYNLKNQWTRRRSREDSSEPLMREQLGADIITNSGFGTPTIVRLPSRDLIFLRILCSTKDGQTTKTCTKTAPLAA